MSKETKNELQKKNDTAITESIKLSQTDIEQMYGGMEQEDITIPRIVVLQGLSPEVSEGKGSPGQFYVKGFDRNLGKGPIEIVVLMRSKSRLRWRDLKLGGGVVCTSTDAKFGQGDPGGECEKCQFSAWTGADGKPGCDLYQNVIVVFRKDEDWIPMALSGNRTKLKPIKNLNSLLMLEMTKGRPLFSKSYNLESLQRTNPQGLQYFTYKISPANNNQPLPLADQQKAMQIFGSIRGKKLNITEEQEVGNIEASENF